MFWTLGYDTIYALQDIEDDALVGVKSSALRLGGSVQLGVAAFYALSFGLAVAAVLTRGSGSRGLMLVSFGILGLGLVRQVAKLRAPTPREALALFKENVGGLGHGGRLHERQRAVKRA